MATDNPTTDDLEDVDDFVDLLDDWSGEDAPEYDSGFDSDADYYFRQAAQTASWNDDGWLDS